MRLRISVDSKWPPAFHGRASSVSLHSTINPETKDRCFRKGMDQYVGVPQMLWRPSPRAARVAPTGFLACGTPRHTEMTQCEGVCVAEGGRTDARSSHPHLSHLVQNCTWRFPSRGPQYPDFHCIGQ